MFYSLVLIISVAAFQLCSLLFLCIVPWIVQNNVGIVVYEDMCPKNMQHCFFPGAGKELYQDCLLTIMSLEISILSSLWKNICYFYHHVKPGFTFFHLHILWTHENKKLNSSVSANHPKKMLLHDVQTIFLWAVLHFWCGTLPVLSYIYMYIWIKILFKHWLYGHSTRKDNLYPLYRNFKEFSVRQGRQFGL